MKASRGATGFTLIELMIVVAIVGILSSVAIPNFQRAQLRTRVAERGTVLDALARGINDTVAARQALPGPAGAKVMQWVGDPNPAGIPGTGRRPYNYATNGWTYLPIIVQGSCYYTYSFQVDEATATDPASAWVMAVGDLDGDGNPTTKQIYYTSAGYTFYPDPKRPETPAPGLEEATTF